MPTEDAIDLNGCDVSKEDMKELLSVDIEGWKKELAGVAESWEKFGRRMPYALKAKLAEIQARLNAAK